MGLGLQRPPDQLRPHRSARRPLNGPNATGNHCPEGFAFHRYPGPGFEGHEKNSAEASYYTWVDHHNVVGLGKNVPISTANLNDGFVALVDGKMVLLQVPFPLGFYAKGFDGRIDDPKAGWKGRGLWCTNGDRTPWLMEGGKGSKPRAVHIQLRPIRWRSKAASDPLAKRPAGEVGRGRCARAVVVSDPCPVVVTATTARGGLLTEHTARPIVVGTLAQAEAADCGCAFGNGVAAPTDRPASFSLGLAQSLAAVAAGPL